MTGAVTTLPSKLAHLTGYASVLTDLILLIGEVLHRSCQNLAHWDTIGELRILGSGLNREQLIVTVDQTFLNGCQLAQLLEVYGGQWLLLSFDFISMLLHDTFELDHAP